MITRRHLLLGTGASIAAPAIVRAQSLMPVRVITPDPVRRLIVQFMPNGAVTGRWSSSNKVFRDVARIYEQLPEGEYDATIGNVRFVEHGQHVGMRVDYNLGGKRVMRDAEQVVIDSLTAFDELAIRGIKDAVNKN